VGNNIANSQTSGFKSGSITFSDIFAGSVGLGVQVSNVNQNFADGGINFTGGKLDMALSGRGFFRMENEAGGVFYGRNGQFDSDADGNIYNKSNGLFLTGFQATGTPPTIEPGAPVGKIRIPTDDMPPDASSKGSLNGNLKADDDNVITDPFNHEDQKTYNYSSQIEATDSLGNKHTIKLYFVQTAEGEWKAYARDETAPDPAGYSELELNFNSSGHIDMPDANINIKGLSLNGSEPLDINLDLSAITKYSGDSSIKLNEIDGQAPGKYQNFVIGDNGEIVVTYSNGKKQTVAQIVLADFPNSGGLSPQGGNAWAESPGSGQPFLGIAGSGSFGSFKGSSLEGSNVDMGQEMVNMIIYQRNYQSNSQTIKTQSELLQTLANLR
jgi:flagellar hook protein FlgE